MCKIFVASLQNGDISWCTTRADPQKVVFGGKILIGKYISIAVLLLLSYVLFAVPRIITMHFSSIITAATSCVALVSAQYPTTRVVNQTTCGGNQYTYNGLAGYGAVPATARDRFGDTIGGIGSSAAIDKRTWFKWGNGSYTGILWAIPGQSLMNPQ